MALRGAYDRVAFDQTNGALEQIPIGASQDQVLLVMGTPSGVGWARKPPIFMKDGDVCEIDIEKVGVLRNPIKDEK